MRVAHRAPSQSPTMFCLLFANLHNRLLQSPVCPVGLGQASLVPAGDLVTMLALSRLVLAARHHGSQVNGAQGLPAGEASAVPGVTGASPRCVTSCPSPAAPVPVLQTREGPGPGSTPLASAPGSPARSP